MKHQSINSEEPNYPIIALALFAYLFLIAGVTFAVAYTILPPIQEALTPTLGLYTAAAVTSVVWILFGMALYLVFFLYKESSKDTFTKIAIILSGIAIVLVTGVALVSLAQQAGFFTK